MISYAPLITKMKQRNDWKNQTEIAEAFNLSQPGVSKILRDAGLKLYRGQIIEATSKIMVKRTIKPKTRKRVSPLKTTGTKTSPRIYAEQELAIPIPKDGIPEYPAVVKGNNRYQRATVANAALSLAKRAETNLLMPPFVGTLVKLYQLAMESTSVDWIEGHLQIYSRMFDGFLPDEYTVDQMAVDMKTPLKPTTGRDDSALYAKRTMELLAWKDKNMHKPFRLFRLYESMTGRELSVASGQISWPTNWPLIQKGK